MNMHRVVVTGGSGKAGRACIKELKEHGYDVFNVDKAKPDKELCPSVQADLSDYGQAIDSLGGVERGPPGVDAVVHLAAIPDSRLFPNSVTFQNNVMSTYNVFEASAASESRTWCGPQARPSSASPSMSCPLTSLWRKSTRAGPRAPTR